MQIQGVGKIRTDDEYKLVIENLARDVEEYKHTHGNEAKAKAKAEEQMRSEMTKLTKEMDKEEERQTLHKIERLRAKIEFLKDGSYETRLMQNITGYMLMKEEYDAQKEKMPFKDILVGIVKGDLKVKEYLKKKFMLSFSNMYALTPAPVGLDVEPIGSILNRMIRECNLVWINDEDIVRNEEETALVPVEGSISAIKQAVVSEINSMVKQCIGEPKDNESNHIQDNKDVEKGPLVMSKTKERKGQGEIEK